MSGHMSDRTREDSIRSACINEELKVHCLTITEFFKILQLFSVNLEERHVGNIILKNQEFCIS